MVSKLSKKVSYSQDDLALVGAYVVHLPILFSVFVKVTFVKKHGIDKVSHLLQLTSLIGLLIGTEHFLSIVPYTVSSSDR